MGNIEVTEDNQVIIQVQSTYRNAIYLLIYFKPNSPDFKKLKNPFIFILFFAKVIYGFILCVQNKTISKKDLINSHSLLSADIIIIRIN